MARNPLPNIFPKICKSCGETFPSRKDYLKRTSPLTTGEYSKGPQSSILEYRNCPCGSTLTIKIEEMRATGDEAEHQRENFKKEMAKLIEKGFSEQEARNEVRKKWGLN